MSPKVVKVRPRDDHTLSPLFGNGKRKVFDVRPYFDKGIFSEPSDIGYFRQVKPFFGGVGWPRGQDFSADTLLLEGKTVAPEAVS